MKKLARDYFRLLRPRQWIKNLAVFASVTFTGTLFDLDVFWLVIFGFFIFCALSSSIYVINDIFDVDKDKLHPFKKRRPLPNGDISLRNAKIIAVILATGALLASYFLSPLFFVSPA